MSRKIKIILIVLVIAIIGALIRFVFLGNSNTPLGEVIRNSLPFGSDAGLDIPTIGEGGLGEPTQALDGEGNIVSSLFYISNTPVSGSIVLEDGEKSIVRYVDRATGHIYDIDLGTLSKTKVSNETIPKVYEAHFSQNGSEVLYRLLEDNEGRNISLSIAKSKSASTTDEALYDITTNVLRTDIENLTVEGDSLYYFLKDSASLVSSKFNGSGVKTLLNSPFKDWVIVNGGGVNIYTKANSRTPGYAYSVTSSGQLQKILGPLDNLTVNIDQGAKRILYGYNSGGEFKLYFKNLQNNISGEMFPKTFPEKCVWSAKQVGVVFCGVIDREILSDSLENWYKGVYHSSDQIWLFDTDTDIAEILSEPKKAFGLDLDVYNPYLSPSHDYLIFTNKNDLSLWALRLN